MTFKLFPAFYQASTPNQDPEAIFIFGDNLRRTGRGPKSGQAIIRDCANALGIATKHAPSMEDSAFFTDADIEIFTKELDEKLGIIEEHLKAGKDVYWPMDGIGTGRAGMKARAPALWEAMCERTRDLYDRYGQGEHHFLLICGGRDYNDEDYAREKLDEILQDIREDHLVVVDGKAKGADTIGFEWGRDRGAIPRRFPADWNRYKKRAGFIRNSEMADFLEAQRDLLGAKVQVVALPGGDGTKMMVDISKTRGFKVTKVPARKLGIELPMEATDEAIARAKKFALKKWKERAKERYLSEPDDLSNSCKFCSLFAQKLFGGEIRGNFYHQYLELGGRVIDLTEDSRNVADLKREPDMDEGFPYSHDPSFFGNPDHRESVKSCVPRVMGWVEEFISAPAPDQRNDQGTNKEKPRAAAPKAVIKKGPALGKMSIIKKKKENSSNAPSP